MGGIDRRNLVLGAVAAVAGRAAPSLAVGTMVEALATRPSDATIKAATAQGRLARNAPPAGIIGLSDPSALEPRVIALAKELGVKWIRAEFHWSQIQPTPSRAYQWARYDSMVSACSAAGIKVLALMTYFPSWLPTDWRLIDTEFQAFAGALVKRYAARGVHAWEVFNEPNLPGFGWMVKGANPADFVGCYALLLARANVSVRSNDPSGVIVLGGLSPDGMAPEKFMAELYRLGGRDCFDVFAFHPYGYQNKFAAAAQRVRAIMAQGRDTSPRKPIWFNEYGTTDIAKQSLWMEGAFRDRTNADGLFWFSIKDFRSSGDTFGLVDNAYKRRAAFATFSKLLRGGK